MKPDNFILYYSQWPALKELSAQELGILLQAIFRTMGDESIDDIMTSLEGKVRIAFQFLMVQIKYDNEKYQKKCELNRQKALKRWGKDANDATAYLAMHNNNNKKDNNNNKNNNSNKNSNKNNNKNNNNASSIAAAVSISESVANAEEAAAAADDLLIKNIKENWMPWFNQLLDSYDSKIPRLRVISQERARRMQAIKEKYGFDALTEVCRRAAGSQFLNGRGVKNKFIATFDWILVEKNFMKVLEGNYNG
jgi:hypothetical protein